VVGLDGVTQANLRSIAELAAKQRLPSIYPAKDYAKLGGLMTYGSSDFHMYRRAAGFVDKIFKGAKPAKALGLTIPPSLLERADQVIE
jgi:putative ABC transport system substrate-binding protein